MFLQSLGGAKRSWCVILPACLLDRRVPSCIILYSGAFLGKDAKSFLSDPRDCYFYQSRSWHMLKTVIGLSLTRVEGLRKET